MNTVDALADHGGKCANFLDTGGKATSETVKTSFQIILNDSRVKAIFVNIFGGLTLCDMIANGVMLAYRDLGIKVPVVVRLRGTNEDLGQKMVGSCIRTTTKIREDANGFCRLRRADCRYLLLMTLSRRRRKS